MKATSQKKKVPDNLANAMNIAAMGAGIAAAVIEASKDSAPDKAKIEKSISELNAKFDKMCEQLKSIQPAEVGTTAKEAGKKPEGSQQPSSKPQDVIYVRKSSEFSFYN